MTVSIILMGAFSFQAYRVYVSQYYLRTSFTQENLFDRYRYQRLAIQTYPIDPAIYREAILTNLAISNRLSSEENLTENQRADIENLLTQAINDSVVLTEILDPRTAVNWEIRGILNKALIGLDGEDNRFSTVAAQSYLNAINRDPSNPELRINLGNIYYQKQNYTAAANYFIQAIQLKNDYANSYYNLAYALRDGGDIENAIVQLEVVQRLVPADSEQAVRVAQEIEEFRVLAEGSENNNVVDIPEGVRNPDVDANSAVGQNLVGPEESANFQLDASTQTIDVQPAEVREDTEVNLNEEDFEESDTSEEINDNEENN